MSAKLIIYESRKNQINKCHNCNKQFKKGEKLISKITDNRAKHYCLECAEELNIYWEEIKIG